MVDREYLEPEIFYRYLDQMRHITKVLRYVGTMLLAATLANIGIVLSAIADLFQLSSSQFREVSLFLLVLILLSFFLALFFDLKRRDGNIIFEELSNELHGKRLKDSKYDPREIEEIRLDTKITLGRFTHTSELPLIPSKYGPVILAVGNLALFFFYISIGNSMKF